MTPGTAGADLGNPWGTGRLMPGGNLRFAAPPPTMAPPMELPIPIPIPRFIPIFCPVIGDPKPPEPEPEPVGPPGRGAMPIRCCCNARAFCMISNGRQFALGGGLRALFRVPLTVELALMCAVPCGSETVRNEGTRRGLSPPNEKPRGDSASEPGASNGVLASEDSSTDPGEAERAS